MMNHSPEDTMRILFLTPPRTSSINRDFAATQVVPLVGIALMIGNLQKEFPEIDLIDASAENISLAETITRIRAYNPDIIAISAITIQIDDAADTITALKAQGWRGKVIVGGPHASRIPLDTMTEFPQFDIAVQGEGEQVMVEIARALRDGDDISHITGIFSRSPDGSIVTAGQRPFIDDLSLLEFPEWRHFKLDKYCASFRLKSRRIIELSVSINRGCPFNCIFCAKIMGNKIRKRPIPLVLDEIERDADIYGARQILFTDETFSINRNAIVELCEGLISRGLNKKIEWIADTRPDTIDRELVTLAKRSGCFFMCFGADNVDDDKLEYLKKGATAKNIFTAVRLCREAGIQTQANYILGLPDDTPQTIMRNIRGAVAVNTHFATFSILVPYPGTRIMEMAETGEEGLRLLSRDWRNYGKQLGYALETKHLSRPQLEKLQRKAYYLYYLRPSYFFNIFRIANPRLIVLYFISHLLKLLGLKKPDDR